MLALILANSCYKHNFIQVPYPTEEDIAVRVFITNNGLNQYSTKNIQLALSSLTLDPISLVIPILGFDIMLSNSKFVEIKISDISFKVHNQSARIVVNDIIIELFFELKIQQKSFPFLSDSGSLTIQINKLGFQSNLKINYLNTSCKQKYEVLRDNSEITIHSFNFNFKCGMQIILNSISQLLSGVLQEQLTGDLGKTIVGVILDSLLGILTNMNQEAGFDWAYNLVSDQRFINGVDLVENFFVTYFTGQKLFDTGNYNFNGWLNDTIGKQVSFITNNDVQYQIEKIVFNSGFKLYLEENDRTGQITRRCTTDAVCIESIRLERFHNTGAKVLVTISQNGVNETLTFLEPVIMKAKYMGDAEFEKDEKYFITFGIRFTNLVSESEIFQDKTKLENFSNYFDETFTQFDYIIDNIIGADLGSFLVIYLDENWMHACLDF